MKDQRVLLKMLGITKVFPGAAASQNIDLDLRKGEILALLGKTGAGKSTLMNILTGLCHPDKGSLFIEGERVNIHSPTDAESLKIGMIHHQVTLVPSMTVAENFILGKRDLALFPSMKDVEREILELSGVYGIEVDPRETIGNLSVGKKLQVELLRLLYRDAKLLILDEPTAVLTPAERDNFYSLLRKITSEERSVLFLTHQPEEALDCSDRVHVLVKGETRGVKETYETSTQELEHLMGEQDQIPLEKDTYRPGDVILKVERLYSRGEGADSPLKNINLKIHKGEILGIAAVRGNGQRELALCLAGITPPERGKIQLKGIQMAGKSPIDYIQMGVGYIPKDRRASGSIADMSLASNLMMKAYRRPPINRKGVLQNNSIMDLLKRQIKKFRISAISGKTRVKFLSPENRLKTILARETDACDGLLVAVCPTAGVDGETAKIVHNQLVVLRDRGEGVLLVSEDLEELIQLSDRLGVLYEGRLAGILERDRIDKKNITPLMTGKLNRGVTMAEKQAELPEVKEVPPQKKSGLLGRAMKEAELEKPENRG